MAQIKANKVIGAEVQGVALVTKGANQIPFRLMKGDQGMIDITKIFKSAPAAPAVAAVLINKSANLAAVVARMTEAGYDMTKGTEENGIMIYAQPDVAITDEIIMKVDDSSAFVISNVQKAFNGYDFESSDFLTVSKTEGFLPSVHMSSELLQNTIYNILEKATSQKDAYKEIAKAASDFSDYLSKLAKALPETAFKTAEELTKAVSDETPVEDVVETTDDGATGEADELEKGAGKKTKKTDDELAAEKEAKMKKEAEDKAAVDAAAAAAKDTPAPEAGADVAEMVKAALDAALAPVMESVGEVSTKLEEMSGRVDEVSEAASDAMKKAEAAADGLVIADAPADKSLKKAGEEPTGIRRIDTGFHAVDAA